MTNYKPSTPELAHVLRMVRRGQIKGRIIGSVVGLNDAQVRACVHELRCREHAICANRDGYWISTNSETILDQVLSLESRMKSIGRAAVGLAAAAGRLGVR